MRLESNQDLYEFLCELRDLLEERGMNERASSLERACQFFHGSSSEFLGESRIALANLLREERQNLTREEKQRIERVIKAINVAFGDMSGK